MKYTFILCCFVSIVGWSQINIQHFREVPEAPSTYSAGTVAGRMVDGLGFRFYWATEGLREQDLKFRPNDDARTIEETVQHIFGMSYLLINTIKAVPAEPTPKASFEEMRKLTLENFRIASELLMKSSASEMEDFKIIFKNESSTVEYPFWNMLNGPIADCLWHTGQIVSFRRSSGNPFNSKVSVLAGKVRE